MKKLLYFAYGSNLDTRRLYLRIGSFTVHSVYRLQDYKLVFSSSGFANIVPSKGSYVEGVLFNITPDQLKRLNVIEALYSPYFFTVDDYIVCTYIDEERFKFRELSPTIEYITCIKRGAKEFKLKETLKICNGILKKTSQTNFRIGWF